MTVPALDSVDTPAEAHPAHLTAAPAAPVLQEPLGDFRSRDRAASRSTTRRTAVRPAATALRAATRQVLAVRDAEQTRRTVEARAAAERRTVAAARRAAAAVAEVRAERRAQVRAERRAELRAERHAKWRAERRAELRAERRAELRAKEVTERRATAKRRPAAPERRSVARIRTAPRKFAASAPKRTVRRAPARMSAVISYARSQVGKDYASGASGPHSFDCSGFTKSAYALAGLDLPHSSGGQAARARMVSRSEARPGDLVVGPGHVGIYMGGGMMIDAGNSRTGVVYRKLYRGLHIERF